MSMEFLLSTGIGWIVACGIYLLLRGRTYSVVLGLSLLGYAVNVFIFAMGRVKVAAAPIVEKGVTATLATTADPLPQALVLTAIVISFAMTAVLLGIALRAHQQGGSDHVDGRS